MEPIELRVIWICLCVLLGVIAGPLVFFHRDDVTAYFDCHTDPEFMAHAAFCTAYYLEHQK